MTKLISHEWANTVIAGLGLLVALILAISELRTPSDRLILLDAKLEERGESRSVQMIRGVETMKGRLARITNVPWELKVYNPLDKPVTVVSMSIEDISVDYLDNSDPGEKEWTISQPLQLDQSLPVRIAPYEVESVRISFSSLVEIKPQPRCLADLSVANLSKCLRDGEQLTFGLRYYRGVAELSEKGGIVDVSNQDYTIVMTTADGAKIPLEFSFF